VKRFPSLVVAAACFGVIGVGAQSSSTDRARHIMVTKVDPAALLIWRSVSATVTDEGVVERVPTNDKEWNDVRRAAELLADGGLMLKREPSEQHNREWLKWSQAIVDAAGLTIKAVDAKSPDKVFEAGERIYDTCVACHGDYHVMTPPQ
jgi:hypothetical protein